MCFVRISEEITYAKHIINILVFITVVESVYCAVRTDSLYKADYVSSLKKVDGMYELKLYVQLCTTQVNQLKPAGYVMHQQV